MNNDKPVTEKKNIWERMAALTGMTIGTLNSIGKTLSINILFVLTILGVIMVFVDSANYSPDPDERKAILIAAQNASTGETAAAIIESYYNRTSWLGAIITLTASILPMWLILSGFVGVSGVVGRVFSNMKGTGIVQRGVEASETLTRMAISDEETAKTDQLKDVAIPSSTEEKRMRKKDKAPVDPRSLIEE